MLLALGRSIAAQTRWAAGARGQGQRGVAWRGAVEARLSAAAGMATDDYYELVIKNPHFSEDGSDFKMRMARDKAVRDLKSELKRVYPTSPSEKSQTLIHGGKMLKDGDKLKDVLKVCCAAGQGNAHVGDWGLPRAPAPNSSRAPVRSTTTRGRACFTSSFAARSSPQQQESPPQALPRPGVRLRFPLGERP